MRQNNVLCMVFVYGWLMCIGQGLGISAEPPPRWREANDRGNRFEGIANIESGSQAIEMIGFYAFQEEYTVRDMLKVRFFLKEPSGVTITAQEIEPRASYWMEAKPQDWPSGSWNIFQPWPVKEVLGPREVPWDNLAVLVRAERSRGPILIIPALLYHSSIPEGIGRYHAYFRSGRSIAGGRYEIYWGCGTDDIIGEGRIGQHNAGEPFMVRLDAPEEDGWMRLRVVVEVMYGQQRIPPTREYCFYHKVRTDD